MQCNQRVTLSNSVIMLFFSPRQKPHQRVDHHVAHQVNLGSRVSKRVLARLIREEGPNEDFMEFGKGFMGEVLYQCVTSATRRSGLAINIIW